MAENLHDSDLDQLHQKEARPHQRLWLSNTPLPQSLRDSGIEGPNLPAFKTQLEVDALEEPVNQLEAGAESLPGNALAIASEESLVTSAKAGKHLAYAELCRRHSIRTLRVVERITRNKEDAEDALQESLLNAFTHLNAFDEKCKFSTWLTRIAINSALMILRKRRSHPESSFEDDMLSELQDSNPASDPERDIIERERDFTLRRAVRRLPPLLREATEIRYLQEVSVSEVAARTRVSLVATKSRLLKARKSLLRALSQHEVLH
jgi:RNA polymerase sigma factor (sigma-70 family)